eukprot:scaffold3023_cov175-Amphora_coffeaeformis.AAC.17
MNDDLGLIFNDNNINDTIMNDNHDLFEALDLERPAPRRGRPVLPALLRGDDEALRLLPRARAIRNNRDNNNNDVMNEDDEDDDNLPIAVELPRHLHHRHHNRHRFARAAVMEDGASNVLFTLLREGVHCKDDLLSPGGCPTVVERCRDHPNEVNFIDRQTGRTPLHEAALRCACIHVVRALMQVEHEVFQFDRLANTPLHLLFSGIASRQLNQDRLHLVVEELLTAGSTMMVNSANVEGYTPLHM